MNKQQIIDTVKAQLDAIEAEMKSEEEPIDADTAKQRQAEMMVDIVYSVLAGMTADIIRTQGLTLNGEADPPRIEGNVNNAIRFNLP